MSRLASLPGTALLAHSDLGARVRVLRALQTTAGNAATQRLLGPRPIAFPHEARIRQALPSARTLQGLHDPAGCSARATPAFTDGNVTHFARENPDLHVAAHEAAHQLQHSGLTRDGGLGAERHANAVADAVTAGGSAAALVGDDGARVAPAHRHYTITDAQGRWQQGQKNEGSSIGRLADTGETWTTSSHQAFAVSGVSSKANDILKTRKSGVELTTGGGSMTVESPDGSGTKTLSSVTVKIAASGTQTMPGDCREAAMEVMGPAGTKETSNVASTPGGQRSEVPVSTATATDLIAKTLFVDKRVAETSGFDKMSKEEKAKVITKAKNDYDWLDSKEKQKLRESPVAKERAKQLGIDAFTEPAVGEAFAVVPGQYTGGYVYHYAAVIMVAGADRLTLENAGTQPGTRNATWRIETYGPESKGQSFHEEWKSVRGDTGHTVKVRSGPPPPDYVAEIPKMTTQELLTRYAASKNLDEQEYLTAELAKRNIVIDVNVDTQEDYTGHDNVFAIVTGGATHETKSVAIKERASGTITVPVASVMPLGTKVGFQIKEYDILDPSDLIGTFDWAAPFDPTKEHVLTGDDAQYRVKVSLAPPAK